MTAFFCAGGDLKQRRDLTPKQWQHQHEIFERGRDALLECPVPVIAAINGHAYAGGLEPVLAFNEKRKPRFKGQ